MLRRLGFVASVLSEGLSTSRTCRLRNATAGRVRELTVANLCALNAVLNFLEDRRILLYRISSNVIPFGSHDVNNGRWSTEFAAELRDLGARLRQLGVRVSTHPGQYTVLNSPHPNVVHAAVRELVYHAELLDILGTDASAKIIVHLGGLYGETKAAALDRFVAVARKLPSAVLHRLVVENDDRLFDSDDALLAARAIGIPVVFDLLHHHANPCRRPVCDVLAEVFDTWTPRDGPPKVHLSSQAAGRARGAHADFVSLSDAGDLLAVAPGRAFDCMLEAKQKDRALLRLRAELQQRGIVESDLFSG